MPSHLTVISYRQNLDILFEDIALLAQPQGPHEFVRCQRGVQLYECVVRARSDVTLLDLVGHGSPARFWLGDEPLSVSGQPAPAALTALNDELPPNARVRLLGCFTGVGKQGLQHLQALSQALNGREVLGTTAALQSQDFNERGLKEDYPHLISSRAPAPVAPEGANLQDPFNKDLQSMLPWKKLLPAEYQLVGRGWPLARADFRLRHGDVNVTLACDCRLVLIEDKPGEAPLLLQWSSAAPLPLFNALLPGLEPA